MNRETHKIIDGGKFVRYVPLNGLHAYRKLGEIEDLMEKYNIDNVEELEMFLKSMKDNCITLSNYNCEEDEYDYADFEINMNNEDENYELCLKILGR